MARKSKACRVATISFETRRGREVSFRGHKGASCAPRKKPSTKHLRHYKNILKTAAKHCKGKSRGAFRACMKSTMPKVRVRRAG